MSKFRNVACSFLSDTRNTYLASVVAGAPGCLKSAVVQAKINAISISALLDSGASENFVDKRLVDDLQLKIEGSSSEITMASTKLLAPAHGKTHAWLSLLNRKCKNTSFEIIDDLCADVILSQQFLKRHREVVFFQMGGAEKTPVIPNFFKKVLGVAAANVLPLRFFELLLPECKPVAIRSRQYSKDDREFIQVEVEKLLTQGLPLNIQGHPGGRTYWSCAGTLRKLEW